jgi:hypothetical protein
VPQSLLVPYEAAVAVGCWDSNSGGEQQTTGPPMGASSSNRQGAQHDVAGGEQLKGLELMSVLRESKVSYTGAPRFSMHPLIREMGRELRSGRLREWCSTGGVSVEVMMVQWMVGPGRGPGAKLVLHTPTGKEPNIAVCQGVMAEEAANFGEAARLLGSQGTQANHLKPTLLHSVGIAMQELGYFTNALGLQEKAVDVSTRVLGPEHPDTLSSINNLAATLFNMGDFQAARGLQENAVDVCTRVLGPEHPITLSSIHNLANTLASMGDFQAARGLQENVVDQHTRVLVPEHPVTLMSINNLAITMSSMGDLRAARGLQEKAVDVHTRVLGPEHHLPPFRASTTWPTLCTAWATSLLHVGCKRRRWTCAPGRWALSILTPFPASTAWPSLWKAWGTPQLHVG